MLQECKCWLRLCHRCPLALLDWLFGQYSSNFSSNSSVSFSVFLSISFSSSYSSSSSSPFFPSFLGARDNDTALIRKGAVMAAMVVMMSKLRPGVRLPLTRMTWSTVTSIHGWHLCDWQTRAMWSVWSPLPPPRRWHWLEEGRQWR